MAKTVELNEANAKKYVPLIILRTVVICIVSLVALFIPIRDGNVLKSIGDVLNGVAVNAHRIVCIIYAVLLICLIIISLVKVISFKNKTSINTESPATILKSPFARFLKENTMSSTNICLTHVLFYLYLMFSTTNDNIDIIYGIYVLLSFAIYIIFTVKLGKMTNSIGELNLAANSAQLVNEASEKLGINMNKISNLNPEITIIDQKSNLDALLKYKKLCESGAITEEEYNAKKEELLNNKK